MCAPRGVLVPAARKYGDRRAQQPVATENRRLTPHHPLDHNQAGAIEIAVRRALEVRHMDAGGCDAQATIYCHWRAQGQTYGFA